MTATGLLPDMVVVGWSLSVSWETPLLLVPYSSVLIELEMEIICKKNLLGFRRPLKAFIKSHFLLTNHIIFSNFDRKILIKFSPYCKDICLWMCERV